MTDSLPQTTYLKDYKAPKFQIDSVYLTFELAPEMTLVKNVMQMTRLSAETSLELDGEHLELLSVLVNGVVLSETDYKISPTQLVLNCLDEKFELEINTYVNPQSNTRLEGLYRTSGNYCTQCEAEGFRTISYFLDRPDVLTLFTTKVIADKTENSVLLANGNLIERGDLPNNQHYAIWQDPHKKPCYLFALVAGNLEVIEDSYHTADGRDVVLKIFVEARNVDKCDHAMASLKKSMQWDEQRFGLIYDLDIFMIVAVDDFNMGAMENKGLNVFNSKFVLAKPDTATDVDFEGIEAVIGHEYFHNWTGNRVTCKNWFQLTLKEGLTVFRDQEFTADMLSHDVKRIQDVKALRNNQFPEDAGPMSHPIQPQSYIEMNNFYTMTVYEKGAEIVRLYHTLLGEKGFRKGMDLYFQRFDGMAVAVEDFRDAMADANNKDLTQMHNWYVQAGTPSVKIRTEYCADSASLKIHFTQLLKGKKDHQPLLIPVAFELLNAQGLVQENCTTTQCKRTDSGWLFEMTEIEQTVVFEGITDDVILSAFRGFSAPVIVDYPLNDLQLSVLATQDKDSFVRWESGQTLILNDMVKNYHVLKSAGDFSLSASVKDIFASLLADESLDNALKSLALEIPAEQYFIEHLVEQGENVAVDIAVSVIDSVKQTIAEIFQSSFVSIYQDCHQQTMNEPYRYEKNAIANRALKNRCLSYLALLGSENDLVVSQFNQQQHMTDVSASLAVLKPYQTDSAKLCLQVFYDKWRGDLLVMDKWFAFQAASADLSAVKSLVNHVDFSYTNPNRLRSVLGVFGRMNLKEFHQIDGSGYQFLASEVLKVDEINPQVAARIVAVFSQWRKYDATRQQLMKTELLRIVAKKGLSKDVYEIASKSLE